MGVIEEIKDGGNSMTERVAILIDGNNMAGGCRVHGVVVDYGTLLKWSSQGGPRKQDGTIGRGLAYSRQIVTGRVYLGPCDKNNGHKGRSRFITAMRELGLEVKIAAEEGDPNKTAVDRDIMLDVLALVYSGKVDRILLLSGDGGFTRVVEMAKALGVQVEVCAFPDASQALRDAATVFWDLTTTSGLTLVRG